MIASSEPGSRAAKYAQRWIQSNIAQKLAIAGGEERAKEAAKPHLSAESLTQPDAFGNVPTVTDPKEAHTLLEGLPLGRAEMMTFETIPIGPLWPMGLLLGEPAK